MVEHRRTPFARRLAQDGVPLVRDSLDVLQINVGKVCNQTCRHCHVDASPFRTESMSAETAEAIVAFLDRVPVRTLDITGGAPELNPHFRRLVVEAHGRGLHVIDRCNLTILQEPGQEDLADFLAAHAVEIIASLPCYQPSNVDSQRGEGVFARSIEALRRLNSLGYGRPDTGLRLNLVYNPVGAHLPPAQEGLEADYKERLGEQFGVVFDRLYTITNMPIARYARDLAHQGGLDAYMQTLVDAHNPDAVNRLMCRNEVSIGWDGRVYDCDFNQMLDMDLSGARGALHIRELQRDDVVGRPIRTGQHCYGCTAGAGSSCGGALA